MTRYAKTMSQALAEMRMDDPKLNKIFDKLKKGDKIKLKTSSVASRGSDFVEYIVKSKNVVNKGRVEKITLATVGNEKAVKKFLYRRDGKVTFAMGDMAASIDDIKEKYSVINHEIIEEIKVEELDEGKMKQFHMMMDDGKSAEEIAKALKLDLKTVKELMKEKIDPADVDDDATDADKKSAMKNMIMQMRQSLDSKGSKPIEFADGKSQKVDPKILTMLTRAHDKIQKPRDKEKFVRMISKSYRDMLMVTKKIGSLKMGEEVELDEVTMSKALDIDPKDVDRMKTLAVLYTRAMKLPAGSPKQDKFKKEIEKLRKELGMNESAFKELVKSVELDEAKSQGMFIVLEKGSKNKVIGQFKDKKKAIDMMKKNAGSKVIQIGKFATLDDKPVDIKVGDELSYTRVKLSKKIKEEVELDEAMKYTHVAVDKKGLVIGFASDEKDAKDMARRNDGKVVKLKKPMSDKKGDMMVNRPFKEEVELDEKYDLYHKTFSDAMQHAYDYAKKKLGITVDPKEIDNKVATGPKKPSEGKTNKYRLKGKGGNLQIQVYNKGGSKPFELNMYKEENEMYDKLTDGNLSLKETVLKLWQEAAKDKDEGNAFTAALAAAKEKGEDTFVVAGKKYDVKTEKLVGGQKKLDKDKDGDIDGKDFAMMRKKKKTEDVEEERYRYLETKKGSLRDAVLQMWGEKKDLTKEMENGKNKKTDTGKEMTPVDMSPKMPKVKESKNKV